MKVSIISKRFGTTVTEYEGILLSICPAIRHEKLYYIVEFCDMSPTSYPADDYNILLHD